LQGIKKGTFARSIINRAVRYFLQFGNTPALMLWLDATAACFAAI
jgi:hypothetical protein